MGVCTLIWYDLCDISTFPRGDLHDLYKRLNLPIDMYDLGHAGHDISDLLTIPRIFACAKPPPHTPFWKIRDHQRPSTDLSARANCYVPQKARPGANEHTVAYLLARCAPSRVAFKNERAIRRTPQRAGGNGRCDHVALQ